MLRTSKRDVVFLVS